jgi:hypothetical protein
MFFQASPAPRSSLMRFRIAGKSSGEKKVRGWTPGGGTVPTGVTSSGLNTIFEEP